MSPVANFQGGKVSSATHTISASGKKPKPKDIVEGFMDKKANCLRDVNAKHGGVEAATFVIRGKSTRACWVR